MICVLYEKRRNTLVREKDKSTLNILFVKKNNL